MTAIELLLAGKMDDRPSFVARSGKWMIAA
jgi:hypothetical protein